MGVSGKIYLTLAFWLALCSLMFFYGFNILGSSNRLALTDIAEKKTQLLQLQAQAESYQLAQKDLKQMEGEKLQPEDFFSVDITLVKEIQTLEGLAKSIGINLSLGGITGVISTVPNGQVEQELYVLPYSISASGSLEKVVNFIETLENLGFITKLNSLSISSAGSGNVNASMGANFYIRKR